MIRSGQVRVWTLSWRDLDQEGNGYFGPLAESALSTEKAGRLAKILSAPTFSKFADQVQAFQKESSFEGLRRLLDGDSEEAISTRSILIRGLVGTGQQLEKLPHQAALSSAGREFLLTPDLTEHVGAGAIDLYLACKKISLKEWAGTDGDIRLLLRADLPSLGEDPAAKMLFTETWRGLWRLVNMFQDVQGLHVELSGLDILSPPDMTAGPSASDGDAKAWIEARALCDEPFHPLIDALVAAEVSGPDHIGDDVTAKGRVVGTMEFGWSETKVGVIEEFCDVAEWRLIPFNPETDQIGETVTRILLAIQETNS